MEKNGSKEECKLAVVKDKDGRLPQQKGVPGTWNKPLGEPAMPVLLLC